MRKKPMLAYPVSNKPIDYSNKISRWEIEYLDTKHGDLEYIYYLWQTPGKTTWISIFEVQPFVDQIGKCIFVGRADKLIGKYKTNTNDDG